MADAPPAASGQRSVTLDIGAIGSGLGDGIDIEEAYRLVAAAMENDAELMAAVGAARERAVETVRGNLAAKSARGGLEEYRRALDAEFEGTIDALTASMGMTASPDQKNTFNSAFDAFAAANASIYKSSADFRRECVDLLAKRALAELGAPCPPISMRNRASRTTSGSSHASRPPDDLLAPRPQGLRSSRRRAQAHRPGPGRADAACAPSPNPRRPRPNRARRPRRPPRQRRRLGAARGRARVRSRAGRSSARTEACGGEAAAAADDERLRDLINGIGTSPGRTPAGTRGRHAAHAKVALDEIDEPATADNIVEFKPRDAERERSAARHRLARSGRPRRASPRAGAACASAAAPVRNYSLNLR
ncbi:MAG: hypothetical protein ACLT98_00655 [Eggerthellaceae bacterium]